MTKRQFTVKFKLLLTRQNNVMIKRADDLWRSGALEPREFGDDYALPKLVLHALNKEATQAMKPLHADHVELANNLEHF